MAPILCPDSVSNFLGFFNLSIAPPLLFYTYVPAIFLSLLLGLFVYYKDKRSLPSTLLLSICTFFTLWVLDIVILWIGVYNSAIMFGWQMTPVFEVPLFVYTIYFAYVISDKNHRDINPKLKFFFMTLIALVFLILPTQWNIPFYNLQNCEGVPGLWWNIQYLLEIIALFWVASIFVNRYRSLPADDVYRKEIKLFGFGTVSFLVFFAASNIIGQMTDIQEISFLGSLGVVIMLGFLVYTIVRFREFNIRLLGAEALVWSLIILIGSQFLYLDKTREQPLIIITAITLIVASILGLILVRGVKRQAILVDKLGAANAGQKTLIHIMNHQIKSYLGNNKDIFAELLTGDYGTISLGMKPLLEKGLDESNEGVDYVTQILQGASADSGTLIYDMHDLDFKSLLTRSFNVKKDKAEKKGLDISLDIEEGSYQIVGDELQLGEALKNLIDNSINYTPQGSIRVRLGRRYDKILLVVKDTGIGIKPEDAPRLFKAGGITKDSIKYNIKTSGYGLIFVKGVVEAHKGRIWFESEGTGKGTTFFVELPSKKIA
jgi:signal transduction histidine kinase